MALTNELKTGWRGLSTKIKVVVVLAALVLLVLAVWLVVEKVRDWRVDRQDAALTMTANTEQTAAAVSQAAANVAEGQRQVLEEQYQQLAAELAAAKADSRRSRAQLDAIRRRYEQETSAFVSSDSVVLSDAELCTRLAAINIDCRGQ